MKMESVFKKLCTLLQAGDVPYKCIEHGPTYTSAESADARGEELRTGGKALLLKADDRFVLVVLPADRKLDSKLARETLGCKKIRFATKEELLDRTGLVPGSVPPFGQPLFEYPLFADVALAENEKIAFNAGSLTKSMVLRMEDYRRAAKPTFGTFTATETPPDLR